MRAQAHNMNALTLQEYFIFQEVNVYIWPAHHTEILKNKTARLMISDFVIAATAIQRIYVLLSYFTLYRKMYHGI